jgi:hypothetical protein
MLEEEEEEEMASISEGDQRDPAPFRRVRPAGGNGHVPGETQTTVLPERAQKKQ